MQLTFTQEVHRVRDSTRGAASALHKRVHGIYIFHTLKFQRLHERLCTRAHCILLHDGVLLLLNALPSSTCDAKTPVSLMRAYKLLFLLAGRHVCMAWYLTALFAIYLHISGEDNLLPV